jgi:hypothetical protein
MAPKLEAEFRLARHTLSSLNSNLEGMVALSAYQIRLEALKEHKAALKYRKSYEDFLEGFTGFLEGSWTAPKEPQRRFLNARFIFVS